MRKKSVVIGLILILAFGCFAFAGGGQEKQGGAKEEEPEIIFVSPLITHPVWIVAQDAFMEASEDMGFEGHVVGPTQISVDEMINLMEVAIAEEVDGIITQGMNPEAMIPVMKKAEKAGIPVVVTNSDIPDAPRLAYLGTDPENLGNLGAQAIINELGDVPIKAAFCVSALDYSIGLQIRDAYIEKFKKDAASFELLTTFESKADMLLAVQGWENVFNTYPEINVAINISGEAGAACGKVVKEMGLQDDVLVMAIDDTAETIDGIKDGLIYGTMTQNFYRKGYQSAQWLMDYIENGEEPGKLINDSGTLLVTKENIDTYSEDMKKPETWK